MSKRRDRFLAWFERSLGGDRARLMERSGLSKGRVSQLFSPKEAFGELAARNLAVRLGLPEDFFEQDHVGTGDGPPAVAAQPRSPWASPISLEQNPNYPAIRRVRFKLSAGASGYAVEYLDDEDAPIVFRREWYASRGYQPEQLFAVKVSNGSMEPGLNDGDTVVVNTANTIPRDGEVFAVNYEGELVIKRLVRDGGQWWLASDNPDQARFPRKVVTPEVHILGRIVHKQSERV